MRRHRGTLAIVALLALGALSLGVALEIYRQHRLPDPEQADGDALMRWLATRDLDKESPEIRQKLVRRLEWFLDEHDAERPFELSEVLDRLDENQTEQFWNNVYLLAELWFLEHVERYHQLGEEQRQVFLAGMVDRVKTWGVLNWIPTSEAPADNTGFAARANLIRQQIQPWIDAREIDEREQIERFLDGVKGYLWARQLQRLLSGQAALGR